MLKKAAGFVAATAVGMLMVGGTAFAAPSGEPAPASHHDDDITFADAYYTFIDGGGALGYGAASIVAGAYAGIATTPALILHSLGHHHH